MSKRKHTRAVAAAATVASYPHLKLGDFAVPQFTAVSAAFGARLPEYPPMEAIQAEFRTHSGRYQDVFSSLFFRGGKLADFGLRLKPGIDHAAAMCAIRSYMSSFDPKHEHKTATVAWALSEWCEEIG